MGMVQRVRFQNKILFEIQTIDGVKYIVKEDREASRRAGKAVYVKKPLNEILNSDKDVINLR